jgi:hypothetical protein
LFNFDFYEENELKKVYPHGLHKTDKMGRPIYIESTGKVDLKKILQVTSLERCIKFMVSK